MAQILNPDDIDTVIYHDPCSDGFASAFAIYYYMKIYHPERNYLYPITAMEISV